MASSEEHNASSIDPFAGVAVEVDRDVERDLLPEESLNDMGDHVLALDKREISETSQSLTEQPDYLVGQQQRQKLDDQIEALYKRVVIELNDNPKDTAFALGKLQQSHDIVLENSSQYEDALFWVAEVQKMLTQKNNIRRWSYSWGLIVFFYALFWLLGLMAGFLVDISDSITINGQQLWYVALAGGIGGVVSILYDLYWHVSIRDDFDRQYVIKYLVQPILGIIMGVVLFFMTNAGLVWLVDPAQSPIAIAIFAVQVVIGFVGGFRHQIIFDVVDTVIKRLMPADRDTPT